MGLRFHVGLGLAGYVLLSSAGVAYGTLTQFGGPANCTAWLPCLETAGLGLVGYLFVHLAITGGAGDLAREGYIPGKRQKATPQIGSGPEDNSLLEVANTLLTEIRLRRVRAVETIAWSDQQRWYECSFTREVFEKPYRLILDANLRGKLNLQEWKTLLSYYFQGRRSYRLLAILEIMFSMLLPLFAVSLVALVISSFFGRIPSAYFSSIVGPPVGLLTLARILPLTRKIFLKHDRVTADRMDRDALLRLFRQIDTLRLPEIENAKRRQGWIARMWPVPNIDERIENLQSQTDA